MIVVAFILIFMLVIFLMFSDQKEVSWADKLQRLSSGTSHAEWTAPEYVLQQVRNDYLMAVRWQRDSVFQPVEVQLHAASSYFTGEHLQQYQQILGYHRRKNPMQFIEVFQAQHTVQVRHFTNKGESCLLVDRQTERMIITKDLTHDAPPLQQSLPDAMVVYQMKYERSQRRWKIERYIQEIPGALWPPSGKSLKIKVETALPHFSGRDN
jgi:hypothetical protein